jgi:hypothetical protein
MTSFNELKEYYVEKLQDSRIIDKFRLDVVQKLAPGIHKLGYEELTNTADTSSQTTSNARQERSTNIHSSEEGYRRTFEMRPGMPFGNPDLDPLAASPGLGVGPTIYGRPPRGMFVGPDDPIFQGPFHPSGPVRFPPGIFNLTMFKFSNP